jgi:hypothetical protein
LQKELCTKKKNSSGALVNNTIPKKNVGTLEGIKGALIFFFFGKKVALI